MFGNQMDTGPQGSGGPWLVWSARGTQDRAVSPMRFYVRDKDGNKSELAENVGLILDVSSLKTGYQEDTGGQKGVAPKWVLGSSPSQLPDRPGDNWKTGFQMRAAITDDMAVDWHQSGAAVWQAICDLANNQETGPAGHLPLVRLTGGEELTFGSGSTVKPILTLEQWVPTPTCLKAGMPAVQPEQPAHAAPAAPVATAAAQPAAAATTTSAVPVGGGF